MVSIIIYRNKMSKIKQYGKLGKKMLVGASTGVIAGMFLMGVSTPYVSDAADFSDYSTSSYSQNTGLSGMHMMRQWNSKSKINSLVSSLGLDKNKVQEELKSGKTLKQILQENGIETYGLQKVSRNNKARGRMWNK